MTTLFSAWLMKPLCGASADSQLHHGAAPHQRMCLIDPVVLGPPTFCCSAIFDSRLFASVSMAAERQHSTAAATHRLVRVARVVRFDMPFRVMAQR